MARVIVVGAGVIGLTSAVRLLEAGHRVDVVARDLPRETTSAVAGGLCYPHLTGQQEEATVWAARSVEVLTGLAEDPATGVVLREGVADGSPMTIPVVEMPVHLDWLVARLEDLGGTLTRLNLSALPATGDGVDVVIDCAGLGARLFAGDLSVVPVRGQVVVVEQVGVDRWCLAAGDGGPPTYVVPRAKDIVLGGTEEHGEWSRTPDPATAEDIVARATRLVPALAGAKVLRHKVGLRPARPEVRVERVGDVVHCYGHGGAGVTLSWGCADEVVSLVG